jgi:hypothetical protein
MEILFVSVSNDEGIERETSVTLDSDKMSTEITYELLFQEFTKFCAAIELEPNVIVPKPPIPAPENLQP